MPIIPHGEAVASQGRPGVLATVNRVMTSLVLAFEAIAPPMASTTMEALRI